MSWQLVHLADVPATPWRNGGGTTQELLAWPAPGPWQVRLSVARVDNAGPFSRYPGLERWFAVLEGEGVDLTIDGERLALTADSAPLRFDGAAAVECALLGGATRDFNLMAAPGRARMERLAGAAQRECAAGRLVAVYAHAAEVRLHGDHAVRLPPGTLAWRILPAAGRLELEAPQALWLEAAP